MLICLPDTKGRDHWINPLYVKMIRRKNDQFVDVWGAFGRTFHIRTTLPLEQVVDQVSNGLAALSLTAVTATGVGSDDEAMSTGVIAGTAGTMPPP